MKLFIRQSVRLFAIARLVLVILTAWVATLTGSAQEPSNSTADQAQLPPVRIELGNVAYLTTRWNPGPAPKEDESENRLVRELVRQGVLMAARDELGLVTRDETLGEFSSGLTPDNANTKEANEVATAIAERLSLEISVDIEGTWEANLFGAGSVRENPIWHHQGEFKYDPRTIYSQFATQMCDQCATIAQQLRMAGVSGKEMKLNSENVPPAVIDAKLAEMNFVSQFAAVRAAHLAIAKNGPSIAWLGVLARGYANLALLTHHTWSSHYDAFSARSLLYAERMIQLDGNSELAQWHRAYSRAVIGAHGAAIDQLEVIEKAAATEDPATTRAKLDLPAWTNVIAPFVRFEHEKLLVAADYPDLTQLVAFLQWNNYRSYMHDRWIYEHGLATMLRCPEAYGVYAVFAYWPALTMQRLGATKAIEASGARLPKRIMELSELPETVRELITDNDPQDGAVEMRISELPMKISKKLRAVALDESIASECSWAILAALIAEEQFVEAAGLILVTQNAVEHSSDELIEALEPLIEGHRYAPYVRSYSAKRGEMTKAFRILNQMTVIDPRVNMRPLFYKLLQIPAADGKKGYELETRAIWDRDMTLPGLIETWYGTNPNWDEDEVRHKHASEFRSISPCSPCAMRVQFSVVKADAAQAAKWEAELKDDPVGWNSLGQVYYQLNDLEGAKRCYQRSLDISVSFRATELLADCYFRTGQMDKWQATLESYLKFEDLGLNHAKIHERIANENIADRQWKKAEPHAVEAAQTYSGWGLTLASRVYEGLQDWEQSEQFAAEATRNYPSNYSGMEWYLWCRRTGRGDVEAARVFAENNAQIAGSRTSYDTACRIFAFRILDGELLAGLTYVDRNLKRFPEDTRSKLWRLFHTVSLAGEVNDEKRKTRAISEIREVAEKELKEKSPNWVNIIDGVCRVFEGQSMDEIFFTNFDKVTFNGTPLDRCDYNYFMGIALYQLGETERAEKCFRMAAFGGPFDAPNATLAGAQLVEWHGPDRGGLPAELAEPLVRPSAQELDVDGNAEQGE